jgi:hypothetical protein
LDGMIASHRIRTLCLALALTLASCAAPQTPGPSAASSPHPPTLPPPTAIPELEASILNLRLVAGAEAGDWTVVGFLENRSGESATYISLLVRLRDGSGHSLGEQVIPLPLVHLGPREECPFAAHFTSLAGATAAEAEVVSYLPGSFESLEVEVEDVSDSPTSDGGQAILGIVANQSPRPAEINEIAILGLSEDGQPLDVATWAAGLTYLEPGQSAPFLAVFGPGPAPAATRAYVDAVAATTTPAPPLTLPEAPTFQLDSLGHPFLLGVVKNEDVRPRWASVLIGISRAGSLVAVAQVEPPAPLASGESRPFGLRDLPGLAANLDGSANLEDLEVEAWVDPLASSPAEATPVSLSLEVSAFESIGDSLFLRGSVTNPTPSPVATPAVMASVRSTTGQLLAAGWIVLGETLPAGQSAPFVLTLALARGADPAMGEFDIVATGLVP